MTIAESDIRINASAHGSGANARKTREFQHAHGEDRRGSHAALPVAPEDAQATLFRSDTALPPRFVAQVLAQALAVTRITPLEVAQTYERTPRETSRAYLYA